MRSLVLAAAAACLAASAAGAAPSDGLPATGATASPAPSGLIQPLAIPGLAVAPAAQEAPMLMAKKAGKPKLPGKRAGAPARKPKIGAGSRHGSGVNYKSGNNIVVNRGQPNYRHYGGGGRVYYDDDDNDGLAGALIGGVVGLGVGAAIANSGDTDNTCVDNNGDGVCDAY